jgi:hypothetical protein
LQLALFRKFRDHIMGVIPARDPGPGKAKLRSGELNTQKVEPRKGMTARKRKGLVPPVSERHHRSVLEEVDERKRVVKRTGVVNERTRATWKPESG